MQKYSSRCSISKICSPHFLLFRSEARTRWGNVATSWIKTKPLTVSIGLAEQYHPWGNFKYKTEAQFEEQRSRTNAAQQGKYYTDSKHGAIISHKETGESEHPSSRGLRGSVPNLGYGPQSDHHLLAYVKLKPTVFVKVRNHVKALCRPDQWVSGIREVADFGVYDTERPKNCLLRDHFFKAVSA